MYSPSASGTFKGPTHLCTANPFGRYFNSKFHIFDALVIVAGFVVDVLLRGPVEEAGSLIVVGRLWRVFKIIEEFSAGADDQIEELQERIEGLEKECRNVKAENERLRLRSSTKPDDSSD